MVKTSRLLAAALLATGISAAALAASTGAERRDAAPDWSVNATWVAYEIQHRIPGTLVSVERSRDGFVARIAGASGTLRRIAIDAKSGEVVDDEVERNFSAAGLKSLAEILPSVAQTGWWDVRSAAFKDGFYEIVAGNDLGRVARVSVDARTGAVLNADVLARANGITLEG